MRQDDSKKEQDDKDVGKKSRNAGSDTAQGGSPPLPENEGVVQKAVHREGEEEETHGDRRRSHRVVSERSGIESISKRNAPTSASM